MLAEIKPQHTHEDIAQSLFPDLALLSAQERQALEQLLTDISEHVTYKYGGTRDLLIQSTDQELDKLYTYQNLMDALQRNDQASAEKYRRALSK